MGLCQPELLELHRLARGNGAIGAFQRVHRRRFRRFDVLPEKAFSDPDMRFGMRVCRPLSAAKALYAKFNKTFYESEVGKTTRQFWYATNGRQAVIGTMFGAVSGATGTPVPEGMPAIAQRNADRAHSAVGSATMVMALGESVGTIKELAIPRTPALAGARSDLAETLAANSESAGATPKQNILEMSATEDRVAPISAHTHSPTGVSPMGEPPGFLANQTNVPAETKTLAEWLLDEPDLLEEARNQFREKPAWQGIDPDNSPVFYRSKEEVEAIRAKPGESGGHHPHGLALGGPEGQKLTLTGETRTVKNAEHSAATSLQRRLIRAIKRSK